MKINKEEIEIILHWIDLVEAEHDNLNEQDEIDLMNKLLKNK